MALTPTPLVQSLDFAEAPRWREGELWFSDFYQKLVRRVDLRGRLTRVVEVPQQPSGLGWLPDGRLLVVSMLDRRVLRLENGELLEHADLSEIAEGLANDMVVDGRGNAYVSSTGADVEGGESMAPIALLRPDGSAEPVSEGLRAPNGLLVTPDGSTLIVAETMGERLLAYPMRPDGTLGAERVWAALPGMHPDGLTLDRSGAIWFGDPMNRMFVRVREGGEISQRLPTKRRAIACALGGESGRTLFLVSAESFMPDEARGARASSIETVEVEVGHAGLP